ncbi:MAG: NupC/NupG family nucleoside CNT transporter [Pseudomonadota bacterium]
MYFEPQNAQSLIGVVFVIGLCWLLSENRRRFPWVLAAGSIVVQVGLVLLLFGLPRLEATLSPWNPLRWLGQGAQFLLQSANGAVEGLGAATRAGTAFVFGFLAGGDQPFAVANPGAVFIFAFQVMPVILVVCALSALLWHWKILKWITQGFGLLFQKTLGLRGPLGLATAATIFMGQVEGPIFIRAYLDKLSRSELFMLIAVGMACVSGSTMVAYATILQDVLPNAAAHVLTASIISAPAGVLLARILIPAPPNEAADDFSEAEDKKYDSSIDAVIKGTGDGLTIVLNVGATLIVFVAFVAIGNGVLDGLVDALWRASDWAAGWAPWMAGVRDALPAPDAPPLTVERILGVVFAPLAFAIGLPWSEAATGGLLLGAKLVLTEFTAFIRLSELPPDLLGERSRMIMTYALCGFANIASVGINVAGYSVLVPNRRGEVMGMVWKAMLAGFLATCLTASLVGLMPASVFG